LLENPIASEQYKTYTYNSEEAIDPRIFQGIEIFFRERKYNK
jgi:hypothetical protein